MMNFDYRYNKNRKKGYTFKKDMMIMTLLIFSMFMIMINSGNIIIYGVTTNGFSNIENISNKNHNIPNNSLSNNIINTQITLSDTSGLVKPSSLEQEHTRIHEELHKIIHSSGNTAKIAKEVQSILQPHFEKEEQLSIPVLGVLQSYVNGTLTKEVKEKALQISQQFKKEYPIMLNEHKQIVAALESLNNTAIQESRQDALTFIKDLKEHAVNEEQITYPATIIIGELLEFKR